MRGFLHSPRTGLVHGTHEAAAVAAIDRLQDALLVYGLDAGLLLEDARLRPDFAGLQALAAALLLFQFSREGAAQAAPFLRAARASAGAAVARERLLIEAVTAWSEGRIEAALCCHLRIAADYPRDLISARIAQVHFVNRGDFRGLRQLTTALRPHNDDVPQMDGMHAFALEQTGDSKAAEALGRKAAEQAFDPWAEHAVAHALDRRAATAEGIAFLQPLSPRWRHCSSFLRCHNWWHLALFHLAAGQTEAALALHDHEVWGIRMAYVQDQVNAVSLLARIELTPGAPPLGSRWSDLAPWLALRADDEFNGFLSLHMLFGLARAGADCRVDAMLERQERRATSGDPVALTWAAAGRGLADFARGRHDRARYALGRALPTLSLLGGSSTQRQLFAAIHAEACRRC